MKKILLSLTFLVIIQIYPVFAQKSNFGKQTGVTAKNGMVVSAHPEASKAGVEILKKGGSAIDAAITVQFALAVVFPVAGNIGGGGFMVYRSGDGKTLTTIDYREKGPAMAYETMFQDKNGNVVQGLSVNGGLASGVPGSVAGMWEIHQKYGKLAWKDLIQPAVDLARNGVALTEKEAESLNNNREAFVKYNPGYTPAFVKDGKWQKGEVLIQPELAHTLELIRDFGRDGFYRGETAEKIVNTMKATGGIISYSDLLDYNAAWREAMSMDYKGYKIISMPPPSSGGVAMFQLLKIVEKYNLKKMGWNTTSTVHLIAEAERRVYADRATHLGDPDFWKVPMKELLDEKYLSQRMQNFDTAKATPSSDIQAGVFARRESDQTTHFSIVDKQGNAVSITTTLNGGFGSKVVVQGGGFFMNNEMDDFSVKPGVQNIYGAIGGAANAIQPHKRMLSSMTPSLVEKNGKLFMVVGTPGGTTIITSVFQTILNVIEHGMTMQEAVSAKRFHHQWMPDAIIPENGAFTDAVKAELEKKGHKMMPRNAIGRVDAILVKKKKKLEGGADPRGDDMAVGY
jgi:gamma-glutamyltranspeptidase/glutathione hydrolase